MIVRYLTARAPLEPVPAGAQVTVAVDAAVVGRYDWTLTRPGVRRALARGKGAGPALRVAVPRQPSGIDVLAIRAGSFRARAPVLVRGPGRHAVLFVVPAASWQAANPYDDDGDGVPNTLDRGGPVGLDRPFMGSGLPTGFSRQEAPLLPSSTVLACAMTSPPTWPWPALAHPLSRATGAPCWPACRAGCRPPPPRS